MFDKRTINKGQQRTIELRQSFEKQVPYKNTGRMVNDYGQMLIIVSTDGVRISMNGPCHLTAEDFNTMTTLVTDARSELAGDV